MASTNTTSTPTAAAPATLQYLKLDFASHRDALLQRVRARWPRAWNDFLNNSFGMVLVDIIAWSTSTLAYMLNRVAGESFVGTMTLRESAVRLGANFGYQLSSATPSVVACETSITTPQTATVTIAKGTLIRTADASALPFEAQQDYYILPGNTTPVQIAAQIAPGVSGPNALAALALVTNGSVDVDLTDSSIDLNQFISAGQTFVQAGTTTPTYVVASIESAPNAISNNRIVLTAPWTGTTGLVNATVYDTRINFVQGLTVTDQFTAPTASTPSYSVLLSRTPVIDGSIAVLVNGQVWTQSGSIASAQPNDLVWVTQTLPSGSSIVTFGDGNFGQSIPTEASIAVSYRTGGGSGGNVALNTINTSVTGLITSTSSPVTVSISNQTATGIGGQDAETLEQARVNIPFFIRANDRAVTLNDYQTLAQLFKSPVYGSIAFARATVSTANSLVEGNVVNIYAWTTGASGGLVNLSPQLRQSATDYLQSKAVGTDFVQLLDGTAQPVPVSLRFSTLPGVTVPDTEALVVAEINSQIDALRPGQPLYFSTFLGKISSVYGVNTVEIATPLSDLFPASQVSLFTPPQNGFTYALARNGVGVPVFSLADNASISLYTAQMPVYPVQAWSFTLALGPHALTILPDLTPGYAMVLGTNISTNLTQDSSGNYLYRSKVNLLTGQISLWLVGAPGDLTMQLTPVAGYSAVRSVNIYIGYTGDGSQTKRQQIRSAVEAWIQGIPIGGTIYASQVSGITSSLSNLTALVAAVQGVQTVTRVAFDSPSNTATSVTALDDTVFVASDVFINNSAS